MIITTLVGGTTICSACIDIDAINFRGFFAKKQSKIYL